MSPSDLKSALVTEALALGFADCRVAPALPAAHRELYAQWIAEGKHGDMAWMARNIERRCDPRIVLPGAKSVIVLALNYYQGGSSYPGPGAAGLPKKSSSFSPSAAGTATADLKDTPEPLTTHLLPLTAPPPAALPHPNNYRPAPPSSCLSTAGTSAPVPDAGSSTATEEGKDNASSEQPSPTTANHRQPPQTFGPSPGARYRIARYAWNEDYHDLIDKKLAALNAFLTAHGGTQRPYVDTGPVLERDFASESGLGWGGKSTMQIHRRLGTWFFLADILTTLELSPDPPGRDMCGTCTRCLVACPTQAITPAAPRRLDARRCISYLTIEAKGPIPLEFRRAIGDRLYGCDACLEACPWNRHAQASREAAFQARQSVFEKPLRDFLSLTDEAFRALFAKSPIKRIKRPAFLRNVCVVLGNTGTAEDLPALETAALDEHPLIAEHAAWAIAEIRARTGE